MGSFVEVHQAGAGQGALWCCEGAQACGNWWFEVGFFVVVEGILVPFPDSVGRQPGQIKRTQVPGGEFGADAHDGR